MLGILGDPREPGFEFPQPAGLRMRNSSGERSHPGGKPKKTSLSSSPKASKDQCSATEQISHSFSLSFCSLWPLVD